MILIRAGLGLDPKALRRLSWAVLRLAFSPCLLECLTEAVAAHFLLGFPWIWALMLGYVLKIIQPCNYQLSKSIVHEIKFCDIAVM